MTDLMQQPRRILKTTSRGPALILALILTVVATLPLLGCGKPRSTPSPIAPTQTQTQAGSPTAVAPSDSASEPVTVTPAADPVVKQPIPEALQTLVDKTFDDLLFDIEPDALYDEAKLTDAIRQLHGQHIRIRGYIFPTARKRGIKQFVLVRDNQECCFGPGAALFDCILVDMQSPNTAEFSIRPVAVEGEFRIDPFVTPDGTTLAVFRILGDSVQ